MDSINKNLPRDTFLYLLAVVTLIVSAVGFGMAFFNYIDFYFSDPATDYYRSPRSYDEPIRQAMAMLIVIFPVFFWVSQFLRKDLRANPDKKELKIRKWLLNMALFVAALVIIGDLVTVINNFLRGELTMRFLLKALTIFFIAGSVFYYYLAQLYEKKVKWFSPFSWVIVCIIVASVVFGFVVIGSPFEQREIRFDEKRINDLSVIQSQVIYYWQMKGTLPNYLSQLEDSISGFLVPSDPENGGSYEYALPAIKPGQNPTFQLCAVFKKSDFNIDKSEIAPKLMAPRGAYYINESWQHDKGRYCFDRTIDPELYPPTKNKI